MDALQLLCVTFAYARADGDQLDDVVQHAAIREEQREHPYMRDFMAFARQTCFSDLPGILPLTPAR